MGGNQAINLNQQMVSDITITTHGSDFLWAIFSVMALSAIIFTVWAHTRPAGTRIFHYLAAIICTTASIAYFTMASNLGGTPIPVEFIRSGGLGGSFTDGTYTPTRAIWYVRYVDWTITTPLLLLEILLVTGLPLADVFSCIFFDLVMIITGLIGALVVSTYKWGFFTFGCFAMFYVWYILLGPAQVSSRALGPAYKKSTFTSALILSVLWLIYPIIWGVADGGNVIQPDSEMVAYGILDLLAKPVFCFIHLASVNNLDFARLTFNGNLMGVNGDAVGYPEKGLTGNHVAGTTAAAGVGAGVLAGSTAGHHIGNDKTALNGSVTENHHNGLGTTSTGGPLSGTTGTTGYTGANTTTTTANTTTGHDLTGHSTGTAVAPGHVAV